MKHYLQALLLLFLPFSSFSQSSNWKHLNTPHSEDMTIDFISKTGILFGHKSQIRTCYISKDTGNTWIENKNIYLDYDNTFLEDSSHVFYFVDNDTMKQFNSNMNLITKLFKVPDNRFIKTLSMVLSIGLIQNDKFLINTLEGIYLFDKAGNILKTGNVSASGSFEKSIWLIEEGRDTCYLIPINSHLKSYRFDLKKFIYLDLDSSGSYSMPTLTNISCYGSKFTYLNKGRIHNKGWYSDNGINWSFYSVADTTNASYISNNLLKASGDTIYLSHYDTNRIDLITYKSSDNGDTWKKVDNINSVNGILSFENNKWIGNMYDNCNYHPVISYNQGKTWNNIPTPGRGQYVSNFSASNNENLFINNQCEAFIKQPNDTLWQKTSDNQSLKDTRNQFDFASLNNGHTMVWDNSYNEYFITEDNGLTFKAFQHTRPLNYIKERKGKLFDTNSNTFSISKDNGKSWKSYGIATAIRPFVSNEAINHNLDLYYGNYDGNAFKLFKYNLLSRKIKALYDFPNNFSKGVFKIATAFTDPTKIYILYDAPNNGKNELRIKTSKDYGSTFTENIVLPNTSNWKWNIFIEQHGNIIIYNDSEILISNDEGITWQNISPSFPISKITDLKVSPDKYLYFSTSDDGLFKYQQLLPVLSTDYIKTCVVTTFEDKNDNCIMDNGEVGINGFEIEIDSTLSSLTDWSGKSFFDLPLGNYNLELKYDNKLYNTCSAIYPFQIDSTKDTFHVFVPIKIIKKCNDLQGHISGTFFRRCFESLIQGCIFNDGSDTAYNAKVVVTLDTFFVVDSFNKNLTLLNKVGNTYTFDVGNIPPRSGKYYYIFGRISCNSPLGDTICSSITSINDSKSCRTTPYVESICQPNIGSYDPNDKTLLVNGQEGKTNFEKTDKIEYLIRFQNTGTDTAFTVRVDDPISKKFDIKSIKFTGSSYPFIWHIEGRLLVVEFQNIQLVDSFKNELRSHGFVKFEIKLDSNTVNGETVENEAYIFFDFNDPVITNTVTTKVGKLNTRTYTINNKELQLYPNPTNNIVNIQARDFKAKEYKLHIYDYMGKMLHNSSISTDKLEVDMSAYPAGMYMIEMQSALDVYVGKVVKQ
jgi:uncharacterized repeat protein (TIGR01451 family)